MNIDWELLKIWCALLLIMFLIACNVMKRTALEERIEVIEKHLHINKGESK